MSNWNDIYIDTIKNGAGGPFFGKKVEGIGWFGSAQDDFDDRVTGEFFAER